MIRSFKICAGALVVALLVGFAGPARGSEPLSRPDFVSPVSPVDAQDVCTRDYSPPVRRFIDLAPQLEVTGDIVSVDIANNELVMAFDDGNTTYLFQLERDCKVMINNEEAQLADLLPGEQAVVVLEVRGFLEFVAREIRCSRD
jgi:hypothetical protein